ncbi:methylmalonyl-CoA mutase small subunit [Rhodococcus sp. X156]|uniref:methylmalonyl-CoA mutase small subunit n=1 Tax=Rhodococcus sp. X156 TaxID=2499145 RepID=UPI000FD8C3CE|nr:methylmalonyl-CoA mutase small subunit [Rhodococcus sp. X156]
MTTESAHDDAGLPASALVGASDGIDPQALAAWRKAVAGVLAKSRRVEPAELGEEPERLLDTLTYDGITVAPLYTPGDSLPEHPLPGVAPFTRGRNPRPDVTVGWHVRTRVGRGVGADADAEKLNQAVLTDLENGVTSLWLALGGDDMAISALPKVLEGVYLDLAPVVLDAGADFAAAAQAFLDVVDASGEFESADVEASLGADPLTVLIRTGQDVMPAAVELAQQAVERPGLLRSLVVDGTVFHDAGASDAQELGASLAAGVEYLRALTDAGLEVAEALAQIDFRHAATDDQFQTIAKLRAGRRLWARVAEVVGAAAAGGARQHVVTSAAMMSQRDPWVNMLRTTVAAFGAGVGGADAVTVLPFDAALPDGAPGVSDAFAARIARNTQLLLLEESHLGRVVDPAGGSYYVEQLTDQVAETAWAFFQELEAAGGFRAALDKGLLDERIAVTRERRKDDIAHRRTALTGVNEFPNLDEDPVANPGTTGDTGALPVIRYAAAFERLRDRSDAHLAATGSRPTAFLATLGPIAEHNVRAGFITNLLASGGIAVVNPGPLDSADAVRAAFAAAESPVAVVCGTDKRYGADGSAAVAALREAGAGQVFVAGAKKGFADNEHQPDGFLGVGINAVTALTGLLETLGVK